MREIFISDDYLFNSDVFFILETHDKNKLLQLVAKKHLWETTDKLSVSTKQNDLLIWNAFYAREIIKSGVTKQYLHPIYNKYYKAILQLTTLVDLQALECKMIDSYLDLLIHYIETTGHTLINKMISYLYLHIEDKLSLDEMAKCLNLSVGYMCHCFKDNLGLSIMKYAKKIKVERAEVLLSSTDHSILEISTALGFCDQSNFCKVFKQLAGVSPSVYRQTTSPSKY